jgi:nanoRNase/pAp phosphatase (c-di-AMP/oligoRNAs hydrolase)
VAGPLRPGPRHLDLEGGDRAKEVTCWLNLLPLNFAHWSKACLELEDASRFEKAVEIGAALLKKLDQDVSTGVRATKRRMIIGGFDVPVANLPHFLASEAGNVLCQGEPFAATYYDTGDGRRSFSLRSDNKSASAVDVSLVAVQYGGGGHRNASGFSAPVGWEGEDSLSREMAR